jgi:RNA polymerase sigma factor (sigma-70 family)
MVDAGGGQGRVDPVLLDRARRDDREAALLIFDDHRTRIARAVRHLQKDEQLEAFHELVLGAPRILRSYDEQRPLGPYLYVVVRNIARGILRRRPTHDPLPEAGREGDAHTDHRDPGDRSADRALIADILGRLDDEEEVVLLTCTGDLTDDEAAALLGLTAAGVRTRRHRLRRRLRSLREAHDGLEDR